MIVFFKIVNSLAKRLYWIAGSAIVAMMLITCTDVVLRYFRKPIPGTYELVCFLGAVAVSFAMAHTSVEQGHVAVSLIVRYLPRRLRNFIDTLTSLMGFVFFALIAWYSVQYANDLRVTGEVSLTLELPFYPFIYGVAFSAAAVCLVLLSDMFNSLAKVFDK